MMTTNSTAAIRKDTLTVPPKKALTMSSTVHPDCKINLTHESISVPEVPLHDTSVSDRGNHNENSLDGPSDGGKESNTNDKSGRLRRNNSDKTLNSVAGKSMVLEEHGEQVDCNSEKAADFGKSSVASGLQRRQRGNHVDFYHPDNI